MKKVVKFISVPEEIAKFAGPRIIFEQVINALIDRLIDRLTESKYEGDIKSAWAKLEELVVKEFPEFDRFKHTLAYNHASGQIEICER